MSKSDKIIGIVIVGLCVIIGNIRLLYWAITDCIWLLLYYPLAFILTYIPNYIFIKDAFKYDDFSISFICRSIVVICFAGIFIFAK